MISRKKRLQELQIGATKMKLSKSIAFPTVLTVGLVTGSVWADGIHVGRSAGGQLLAEVEAGFVDLIRLSAIAPGGLVSGWSDNNPGLTDTLDADAGADFLPLGPGANIWLEVLSFDPALEVIDASFQILKDPGGATFIGDMGFDTHPTYLINEADPGFDSMERVWEATFVLSDRGSTGYASSDPITLRFTNAPIGLSDFSGLVDCFTGPCGEQSCNPPLEVTPICRLVDFDGDGDVDIKDFAAFQRVFSRL